MRFEKAGQFVALRGQCLREAVIFSLLSYDYLISVYSQKPSMPKLESLREIATNISKAGNPVDSTPCALDPALTQPLIGLTIGLRLPQRTEYSKMLRYRLFVFRVRAWKYVRQHWTTILLSFLTISSTVYGIARWESSQTFNGLDLYCISAKVDQYPVGAPTYRSGGFSIYFGYKNPNYFPVNAFWTSTPMLNDTNYVSGFLQGVIPARSSIILRMLFLPVPFVVNYNYTLGSVISYERYSILGDIFSEPRIFFISSTQGLRLGNNATSVLANRLPAMLWSIFIQHSNLLQSDQLPCPIGDIP